MRATAVYAMVIVRVNLPWLPSLSSPDKANATSDILACDEKKIFGKVSITPSSATRLGCWDLADPSRASYKTTSHELPPDSKSPISFGIESHEVTSLGYLGRMLFQWASWLAPLCVPVLATSTRSMYDTNFHLALLASHIRIRQAYNELMKTKKPTEPQRRHSEGVGLLRVLPHTKFRKAVTATRAIIRFKNSQKDKSEKDEDDAEPTPTAQLRRCDRCLFALKGPNVVCTRFSLSSFCPPMTLI